MEAKVKDNARFFRYVFFSGHEYIKGEWRAVPTDSEDQARKELALDIRDGKKQPVEKVELQVAELPTPDVILPDDLEQLQEEKLEEKHTRRGRKSTRKEIESLDAEG